MLDVHGTLDLLADAIFNGKHTVQARLLRSHPKRTAQDLVGLDLGKVLGSFETRYNALDTDRTYNLRVAARHVDGVVLMPGEEFDFNAVVGERSEANGFRPAPVIAGGELADGVGGGTCQIAGTLYAAAYFAGLPFTERNTHTRPSSYLRLGLDATVAYPKLNLKLKNDLPTPIAIGVQVGQGRVNVQVRGSKDVRKQVSFVRRLDEVTPYTEITRQDPSLPAGVRVLAQRGVAGFRITSFRIERDLDTQQLVRERSTGTYPPTTQIWRVGSGGPKPEGYVPPPNDPHHEYTTDEYLVLTQGEATDGLEETVKREGRTGVAGWTKLEGMPQVE
jgi:vancomycin resistance protein YoaR